MDVGFKIETSVFTYGWGDIYKDIYIPLSLFTNNDEYKKLQELAEEAEQKRIELKSKEKQIELEKKLKEARKFIEKHG
ncbi:hypothetical protein IFU39_00400 [Paenibacillus sp. CFBP 13594]|uniref:hypothetical protein n=1 Tax=Paenibacillus sp. CFBP 13594 TaxID=2774037 RepID=UPI00178447F0|nr:hypothetical protein [Paenibacillus sp. CFBP 13594]MBD8836279.1 hypothetical protein [Paenibacillus sp. CFBP 13594]